MQSLVWASAKSQFWRIETTYVKERVGRERIRRNKDTLRELQCLQEILADLQQGRCGPEALRRAHEHAAGRWVALHKAAASRGVPPERLCPDAEPRVVRFLRARGVSHNDRSGGSTQEWGSEAAVSTRAPSTVQEMDRASTATDLRSESAATDTQQNHQRPGRGQRMAPGQLDRLAVALQGSLDEEYTALLAAIEEVQSLMEAELQGRVGEPTQAELEAFVVAADEALKVTDSESLKATRNLPWTYTYFFGPQDETSGDTKKKDLCNQEQREPFACPVSPCRNSIQRVDLPSVEELDGDHSSNDCDREPASVHSHDKSETEKPVSFTPNVPTLTGNDQREVLQSRRWADISESDEAEPSPTGATATAEVDKAAGSQQRKLPNSLRWADMSDSDGAEPSPISSSAAVLPAPSSISSEKPRPTQLECAPSSISSEKPRPTQLGCNGCGATHRQAFSRRNWKRLRASLESQDPSQSQQHQQQVVLCVACAGTTAPAEQ